MEPSPWGWYLPIVSPTTPAHLRCGRSGRRPMPDHGVEDAALHRLEAVAHVGDGAGGDDRQGVGEERLAHLLGDGDVDDLPGEVRSEQLCPGEASAHSSSDRHPGTHRVSAGVPRSGRPSSATNGQKWSCSDHSCPVELHERPEGLATAGQRVVVATAGVPAVHRDRLAGHERGVAESRNDADRQADQARAGPKPMPAACAHRGRSHGRPACRPCRTPRPSSGSR